jgi:hypothetical protein
MALHHVAHGCAAAFEHALDIVEHLAGFGGDVAGDDFLGGRIDGDLAGNVNEIAGPNGGRVGSTTQPIFPAGFTR